VYNNYASTALTVPRYPFRNMEPISKKVSTSFLNRLD
jgi:hypothetical protein